MKYAELFLDGRILLLTFIMTVAIEAITLAGRYLLGYKVFSDTPGPLRQLTFGIRIHHSYLGVGGLFIGFITASIGIPWAGWLLIGGVALLVSDLFHHFCILWPLTGHHEFFISFPD